MGRRSVRGESALCVDARRCGSGRYWRRRGFVALEQQMLLKIGMLCLYTLGVEDSCCHSGGNRIQ